MAFYSERISQLKISRIRLSNLFPFFFLSLSFNSSRIVKNVRNEFMSQKSLTTLRPVSANEFYTLRSKPKTFHKSQGNYVS